jgi:hypothetical protein
MEETTAYVSIGLCFIGVLASWCVPSRTTRHSLLPLDGCRLQTDVREHLLESTQVYQREHQSKQEERRWLSDGIATGLRELITAQHPQANPSSTREARPDNFRQALQIQPVSSSSYTVATWSPDKVTRGLPQGGQLKPQIPQTAVVGRGERLAFCNDELQVQPGSPSPYTVVTLNSDDLARGLQVALLEARDPPTDLQLTDEQPLSPSPFLTEHPEPALKEKSSHEEVKALTSEQVKSHTNKDLIKTAIASFPYKACLQKAPNTHGLCGLDLKGKSATDGMTILEAYLQLARKIVEITGDPMKVLVKAKSKMKLRTKAYLDKTHVEYLCSLKGNFQIKLH